MYKHWRYKPSHPNRRYPFYAQEWRRFDQLLDPSDAIADADTKAEPSEV
jgi:hypothetical protein